MPTTPGDLESMLTSVEGAGRRRRARRRAAMTVAGVVLIRSLLF